jgi:hypothetical protein
MGAARRRGTFEQRVEQSKLRQIAELEAYLSEDKRRKEREETERLFRIQEEMITRAAGGEAVFCQRYRIRQYGKGHRNYPQMLSILGMLAAVTEPTPYHIIPITTNRRR